jgi:hypothetical protein
MIEEVSQKKKEEIEQQQRLERFANVLLNLPHNGLFYQGEMATYLIPVPLQFGWKAASLKVN